MRSEARAQSTTIAERALELIFDGAVVGLGSGRAATAFVRALGARVKAGLRVRGVATSEATARLATELGIPLASFTDVDSIDVDVDGADEVDEELNLIKGYGGALVREKIVAAASKRVVILVGREKLVPALGARGRLPVEVVPFGLRFCARRLRELGCPPTPRTEGGRLSMSDNGNYILDCAVAGIPDPEDLERRILSIPGVVGTGLFLGMADRVLIDDGASVEVRRRAPLRAEVRQFDNMEELSRATAEELRNRAAEAIGERGRFTVALAGGSTPRRLYEILSSEPGRGHVRWDRVEFFFGDERAVQPDDERSNFRMASEALLGKLAIPDARVHRIRGEAPNLDAAARGYEDEIAHAFGVPAGGAPPALDLVLLGMGAEGHTASLFPHTSALKETTRWVVAHRVPELGADRVTMTAPLLNAARCVIFLVAGAEKADALRQVLVGPRDPERLPAQLIRPVSGRLLWFVDCAAATRLSQAEGAELGRARERGQRASRPEGAEEGAS